MSPVLAERFSGGRLAFGWRRRPVGLVLPSAALWARKAIATDGPPMNIRDAHADDFTRILALNRESVHFLSPLTPERLALLHRESAYHRVVEAEGQVAAFLLAFREAAAYDSPNYLWFQGHFPEFLYIDRVVVSSSMQGRGIGRVFYADVFEYARISGAGWITCEFDVDPPNERSRRFHEGFGFQEVGTQAVGPSRKLVSLQAVAVDGPGRA